MLRDGCELLVSTPAPAAVAASGPGVSAAFGGGGDRGVRVPGEADHRLLEEARPLVRFAGAGTPRDVGAVHAIAWVFHGWDSGTDRDAAA